jgi:molybdate transport system ATP-binding protein
MTTQLTADFARHFPGGPLIRAALAAPADTFSVTALFGPSGGGKTTVLRCLAGLEQPDEGHIRFGGETWFDAATRLHLPPQQRRIGYLSQDYSLFPHLSVAANIAYGLGGTAAERRRRVADMIDLFGLRSLEARYPWQLSGGEQQRTALARTLVRRPRLLLLDEPLSALDAPTREPLRRELRRRLNDAGIPTVLVTHDRAEVLSLADVVVVLDGGRVRQTGPVDAVFARPADVEVARIVGVETIQPARVVAVADGWATIVVGACTLTAAVAIPLSGTCTACIRAEDVVLMTADVADASTNRLAGKVSEVVCEGALVRVHLDCGFALTALTTRPVWQRLALQEGDPVAAIVSPQAIHLVPAV